LAELDAPGGRGNAIGLAGAGTDELVEFVDVEFVNVELAGEAVDPGGG
jgi:hypothetical protein